MEQQLGDVSGTTPNSVVEFVADLDRRVRSVLGDRLTATYLHGSAALGGFVVGRSDVDVLMLVEADEAAAVGRDVLDQVVAEIRETSESIPGRGIELSIVTTRSASRPAPPWPFLLHVATGPGEAKTVLGVGHPGDPDLLMHYAVCRTAGIAVTGPSPDELIGEIGRVQILEYLDAELVWARQHADPTYGVLNACRAWQYAVTGELVSKLDGAAWMVAVGGSDAVIAAAVACQTGSGDGPDPHGADRLVGAARAVVARARLDADAGTSST